MSTVLVVVHCTADKLGHLLVLEETENLCFSSSVWEHCSSVLPSFCVSLKVIWSNEVLKTDKRVSRYIVYTYIIIRGIYCPFSAARLNVFPFPTFPTFQGYRLFRTFKLMTLVLQHRNVCCSFLNNWRELNVKYRQQTSKSKGDPKLKEMDCMLNI